MEIKKEKLVTGTDFNNLSSLENFIESNRLFGATLLVPASEIKPTVLELLSKYCLTALVPLDSTDGESGSIVAIEKENPGLEAQLKKIPANKLCIHHEVRDDVASAKIITLAAEFKNSTVVVTGNAPKQFEYFAAFHEFSRYVEQCEEFADLASDFAFSLAEKYAIVQMEV